MGVGHSLPFDSIGFVAPMAVRLPMGFGGFVGVERVLEFGVLGTVRQTTAVPLDAMGILNALYYRWYVQRKDPGELLHLWQVLQKAGIGWLDHSWTVLTEQDPDFPHLWRVIEPQLVILHGEDIQLPFGKIEKVG